MTIRIGQASTHGIALEHMAHPPEGVQYQIMQRRNSLLNRVITPPVMWNRYDDREVDIVESAIFPVITKKPLVYTPADAYTLFGFDVLGIPFPRWLKVVLVNIFLQKARSYYIVFKSEAGKRSLNEYSGDLAKKILLNSTVVYPAVKSPVNPPSEIKKPKLIVLFAGGQFFIKGGAHVVDAFLKLRSEFKNICLKIYTRHGLSKRPSRLVDEYLGKIRKCPDIELFELMSRQNYLNTTLKSCDIFVMPTYRESYGYSVQEAIGHGKPVVTTDIFALPEIVTHERSGFLIRIRKHPFIRGLRGYEITRIPKDFKEFMDHEVYRYLKALIRNPDLRMRLGMHGWREARIKFSFEQRNRKMMQIYSEVLTKGSRFC